MKQKKQSKYIRAVIVTVLLTVIVAAIGGAVAKYVNERDGVTPISSQAFFFESNYLKTNNLTYKLNSDTNQISIELYNFENDNRISEMDCTYTVTVASADGSAFKVDDETVTQKTFSHTTVKNQKDSFSFSLSELSPGKTYTVSATSDGGYKKTLSATFETRAAQATGIFMNVQDTEHYVLLTVWTENSVGMASIQFPTNLIPDATDPILRYVTSASGNFTDDSSFSENGAHSRSYRFFKPKNYDSTNNSEFQVKMGEMNAQNAQLPE